MHAWPLGAKLLLITGCLLLLSLVPCIVLSIFVNPYALGGMPFLCVPGMALTGSVSKEGVADFLRSLPK